MQQSSSITSKKFPKFLAVDNHSTYNDSFNFHRQKNELFSFKNSFFLNLFIFFAAAFMYYDFFKTNYLIIQIILGHAPLGKLVSLFTGRALNFYYLIRHSLIEYISYIYSYHNFSYLKPFGRLLFLYFFSPRFFSEGFQSKIETSREKKRGQKKIKTSRKFLLKAGANNQSNQKKPDDPDEEQIEASKNNDGKFERKLKSGKGTVVIGSKAGQDILFMMKTPVNSNTQLPDFRKVYKRHQTLLKNGTYVIRFITEDLDFPTIELSLAKYYNVVDMLNSPNRFQTEASVIDIETRLDQTKLFYKKFVKFSRARKSLALCQRSVTIGGDEKSLVDNYEGIDMSMKSFFEIGEVSVRPEASLADSVFGSNTNSDLVDFSQA